MFVLHEKRDSGSDQEGPVTRKFVVDERVRFEIDSRNGLRQGLPDTVLLSVVNCVSLEQGTTPTRHTHMTVPTRVPNRRLDLCLRISALREYSGRRRKGERIKGKYLLRPVLFTFTTGVTSRAKRATVNTEI